MQLSAIVTVLERIAPLDLAEPWDNVGLLVGDPAQEIKRTLLTVDYTAEVAQEAQELRCGLVIAYHPVIFDALKRITAGSPVFCAIREGIAIYCPHTALDVAEGGTNDMLADALGLTQRRPLRPVAARPRQYKLVTFVPPDAVERVSAAVFGAGAGRIGNYSSCSFRTPGTGTFFGESGANPAVGQAGRLEHADEIRLEMVVPIETVDAAVAALRRSHPYEEPAFDLVQLAAAPGGRGMGRIGELPRATERGELIERIRAALGVQRLLVAGPTDGAVERAACCAGSCGDLVNDALAQGAELYLTGEMRHHDALRAAQRGMTVVCALHTNSERAMLARLAARLARELPETAFALSRKDRDPFTVI